MIIQASHQLNSAEAVNRVENLLASLASRTQLSISHLTHRWNPERTLLEYGFQISGMPVSGLIHMELQRIIFEAKLPPALRFFQKRIHLLIQEKLHEALAS